MFQPEVATSKLMCQPQQINEKSTMSSKYVEKPIHYQVDLPVAHNKQITEKRKIICGYIVLHQVTMDTMDIINNNYY